MKQYSKLSALVALLIIGTIQSRADQTNVVQTLAIHLGGLAQGPSETNGNIIKTSTTFAGIGTADVIQQLGTSTGNSFSSKASLVIVTPLPSGNSSIQVRDGAASVDVSSFFTYEVKSDFVSSAVANVKTGRSSSTDYSIQRLALIDATGLPALTLHFDVQGVAVDTTAITNTGTRVELDAGVSGSGDQGGNLRLFEGTFRIYGYSLEVVPSNPPPNA